MKVKYFKIFLFLALSITLAGQDFKDFDQKLSIEFNNGSFKNANVSLSVFKIDGNQEIIGYRSRKKLIPASSLKLLTTLTALKILGPQFTFETSFGYVGNILSDGTLKGDLIVRGGGDPTLGSSRIKNTTSYSELFTQIESAIKQSNINCIDGKLIIDASIYDNIPIAPSWQWNDIGNYYATGAWGININENLYQITFNNKGKLNQTPKIESINPQIDNLVFTNELKLDKSHTGDQAYIFGGPFNYSKNIRGTIPIGNGRFSIKGSIPNPPLFLGEKIKAKLAEQNIFDGNVEVNYKPSNYKITEFLKVTSPKLQDIVRRANLESHNLYTESILKMMGYKVKNLGSLNNGIDVIKNQLQKYGIEKNEITLHDASGLSTRNSISSHAMAKFISSYSNEISMKTLVKFLARGSYEGTAKNLFKNSSAEGRIYLKSGSMEGIQSYSGIIKANDNKWYSFSFIVNGFNQNNRKMRQTMEQIIIEIFKEL